MKKSFLTISLFTSVLISCSGSSSSEKSNPVEKDSMEVSKKADSIPEKKEESKEPVKETATTPNGTYINGQKSKLTISNYSAQGFNFSYKLKGACDGFEDAGLAVFTSKNTAVQYSEDGSVIVSFTVGKDGSIEFGLDMGLDYFGMDCIKFFDSNFVKK